MIDGTTFYARMHNIYSVSAHERDKKYALVDRGANGGIAGDDVRIIESKSFPRFASVQGIDNNTLENIPVVSVG